LGKFTEVLKQGKVMQTYILEYQMDKMPGMIRYVKFQTDNAPWVYYDEKLHKDFFTFVKIYKLDGEVVR
jgi:hypothetical protein